MPIIDSICNNLPIIQVVKKKFISFKLPTNVKLKHFSITGTHRLLNLPHYIKVNIGYLLDITVYYSIA